MAEFNSLNMVLKHWHEKTNHRIEASPAACQGGWGKAQRCIGGQGAGWRGVPGIGRSLPTLGVRNASLALSGTTYNTIMGNWSIGPDFVNDETLLQWYSFTNEKNINTKAGRSLI